MKKKSTIILSVVMLIAAVALAGTAAFAWFVTSRTAPVSDFSVTVVSAPKLTYEFLRSTNGTDYSAADASQSFVDAQLLPGEKVYCRITVNNGGDTETGVRISFVNVSFVLLDAAADETEAAIAELDAHFRLVTSAGSLPIAGGISGGELAAGSITVPAGGSVNFNYTFELSSSYGGAAGRFRVTAGGIKFDAS